MTMGNVPLWVGVWSSMVMVMVMVMVLIEKRIIYISDNYFK